VLPGNDGGEASSQDKPILRGIIWKQRRDNTLMLEKK